MGKAGGFGRWAARFNTGLLIKIDAKRHSLFFSFLFFQDGLGGGMAIRGLESCILKEAQCLCRLSACLGSELV